MSSWANRIGDRHVHLARSSSQGGTGRDSLNHTARVRRIPSTARPPRSHRPGASPYHPTPVSSAATNQSAEQRRETLKQVLAQVQRCVRCQELAATRKNVVFGAGNADAEL